MEFNITKIYSDEDGETHFQDIKIPLNNQGEIGFLSDAQKVKKVIFRKVVAHYDYDFHTAPAKQYIILLDGEIEIETSSGDKRSFTNGAILVMEDITGRGHKTRNLKPEIRTSIFIEL